MTKAIIWDFNGTLLDDVSASVGAVNLMLQKRGLPLITCEWYTDHLIMPLERFYEQVGVDVQAEPIQVLSLEFQQGCAQFPRPIFPECLEALSRFQKQGLRQLLFSSLNHEILMKQAEERGILSYFETVRGRGDHSLGGKAETIAAYLKEAGLNPQECLIVGDLITDWQMAQKLGIPCLLIPKGHQSEKMLLSAGAPVIRDAAALIKEIEGWN